LNGAGRFRRRRERRRDGTDSGRAQRADGTPAAAGDGHGLSASEEARISQALVALRETTAKEVMTPRVDVVALEAPVTPEDLARAVKESGHSRFPVYEEDLDHLVGVLFVKDLFRAGWPDGVTTESIARRLRTPFLVPEGRRVLELLAVMRGNRHAFAVVLDEYGGVEGVLTIKDLVSELVGDLRDEFDKPEEAQITAIDTERWLIDGATPVEDVSAALGIEVPEGDYVTLGGFLFDRFGRIPDEGDRYELGGWEFRISEMDRRRVSKVVVRAPTASMGSGPSRGDGK
jgi:putative hemolysin